MSFKESYHFSQENEARKSNSPLQAYGKISHLCHFGIQNNRNENITQLQRIINQSPKVILQRKEIKSLVDDSATIQKQVAPNLTGMPDQLKSGIEQLSGHDMSDIRVHYNSSKPAQLNAHAYAQGSDIHIAQGQEKHLPHEAWHTVQQKQNRVQPTMQAHGVAINDNISLEREADVMGAKAMSQ